MCRGNSGMSRALVMTPKAGRTRMVQCVGSVLVGSWKSGAIVQTEGRARTVGKSAGERGTWRAIE